MNFGYIPKIFDRYKYEKNKLGKVANIIDEKNKKVMKKLWQAQLEKL